MQNDEDYNSLTVKQRISEVFNGFMKQESSQNLDRVKSLLSLA